MVDNEVLTKGQVRFLDWVVKFKTTTANQRNHVRWGKEKGYMLGGARRKTYQKFRESYLPEYRFVLKEREKAI